MLSLPTFLRFVVLALGSAAAAPPPFEASLRAVARGSAGPRALAEGDTVSVDESITFRATVLDPGYVYVLERLAPPGLPESIRAVAPGPHDVLPTPLMGEVIVPHSGAWKLGDPEPEGWRSGARGLAEYVLVLTSSPRDVTFSKPLTSVEDFLAPPPWVGGQAGEPGTVLARTTLRWMR